MKLLFIITFVTLLTPVYSQSGETSINLNFPPQTNKSLNQYRFLNNSDDNYRGRIDLSIYLLPGLNIGGAEKYLGSEITLFDETSWEENIPENRLFDTRTDYGDRTVPVITSPETDIPVNINIGYTYNDIRAGISWFRIAASYDQTGEVPGLNIYDDDASEGFEYGFVSFWNMGWDLHVSRDFPASWIEGFRDLGEIDEYQEPDKDYEREFFPEKGSTQWRASHDISFNSVQLTIQHPVIENRNLRLSLAGGLQYGRWSDNLIQSLNMKAYTELTDRWIQMVEVDPETQDSVLAEVFWDNIFDNDITLETSSSARFNSFGLMSGIEADWKVNSALSFSVNAGISTLSGEARFSGSGIDIDDIVESDIITIIDINGNLLLEDPLEGNEYLYGEFNLPDYSMSVLSVNYYLSILASYELTDFISLMAGYSYFMWKGLPMSPRWSYSDEFTKPYGPFAVEDSWDKEVTSNISASGFKLGIALRIF